MVFLCVSVAILVTLHLGGVCSASPGRRVVEAEVEVGEVVVLPCNGSVYLPAGGQREESVGGFRWEAMGADVVSVEEGEVNEGRGYQGRVSLAPEDRRRQGDWTLVLHSVLLSDSDMYECIWDNSVTVTTVFVKVKEPSPERAISATRGEAVRLPCYGDVPKNLRSNELYVQWLRDGHEVALFDQDSVVIDDKETGRLILSMPSEPLGEFALIISPVALHDQGLYHCFYKTRSFEEAKPGIPESVLLTVKEFVSDAASTETAPVTWTQAETETSNETRNETSTETSTETSNETSTETMTMTEPSTEMSTQLSTETRTEVGTTVEVYPALLEDTTQQDITTASTTSQPIGALEETETEMPLPEEGGESSRWEQMPWVRFGLISGVLLITAMVLCVLGALHKI